MKNFKKGDKIRRKVIGFRNRVECGKIYTFKEYDDVCQEYLFIYEFPDDTYREYYFDLVSEEKNMKKFKEGDRIRRINSDFSDEMKIGNIYTFKKYVNDKQVEIIIEEYPVYELSESDFELVVDDEIKYGDILIQGDGVKRKVLGVCGDIVFLSLVDDFDGYLSTLSKGDLKDYNYKKYVENEITIEEAEKKFNIKIKQ